MCICAMLSPPLFSKSIHSTRYHARLVSFSFSPCMRDLLSTPRNQFVNIKQSQITCKHVNRNFFCTSRQVRYHRNCIADIDSPMTPITDLKKKKRNRSGSESSSDCAEVRQQEMKLRSLSSV